MFISQLIYYQISTQNQLILTTNQMSIASVSTTYDRFIGSKNNFSSYNVYQTNSNGFRQQQQSCYSSLIRKNLFGSTKSSNSQSTYCCNSSVQVNEKSSVHIQSPSPSGKASVLSPIKILDIPNIKDDFYLSLIDWHQSGPICIAINNQIFIYTPQSIFSLGKSPFLTYVSSVKFNQGLLNVGLSNGGVQVYDLQRQSMIRMWRNHQDRVAVMQNSMGYLITGSKDTNIHFNDLRIKHCLVNTNNTHKAEICSLKVKPYQNHIFASGANDNKAYIWDIRNDNPMLSIKGHKGAIKAMSWCPWRSNVLATGGGNNDQTIKIWGQNGDLLCTKQMNCQISGLQWNSINKSLISSQGTNYYDVCEWRWDGQNELDCKSFSKNYNKRVLSMIQSKQEDMICTLSSDETLKFFQLKNTNNGNNKQIYDSQRQFQLQRFI